jgi:hypothetical protein
VVAVGALGPGADETATRSGLAVASATRSLAKQLYGIPRLRPHADEASVEALAGAAPDATWPPAAKELADLRAALGPDPSAAATRAVLESIGRKVDVEGLVLVSDATPAPTARLVRILPRDGGAMALEVDGATFAASPVPAPATESPSSYTWNATSIASLLGPAPTPPAPPPAAQMPLGPRRDAVAGPKPPPTKKPPTKGKDAKGSKTIFESPWFWVAAGGVAAIGVTALVVSQTVNTQSGNVHLQGKVLP